MKPHDCKLSDGVQSATRVKISFYLFVIFIFSIFGSEKRIGFNVAFCDRPMKRRRRRRIPSECNGIWHRSLPSVCLRIRFAWQINLVRSIDAICSPFFEFMSQLDWGIRTNESVHKPKASQIRLHISKSPPQVFSLSSRFGNQIFWTSELLLWLTMHCTPTYKSNAMRKTFREVERERRR